MPPRRRHYRRRRAPATSKKVVRKVVRREIMRASETKEISWGYSGAGSPAVSFASVGYGSATIATQLCAAIAQGTADYNRIGSRIYVTGLMLNLAVQNGDTSNYFRFIVVRPKRSPVWLAGTSALSVTQWTQNLFANSASAATQWASPIDTDRYRVLYDRQVFIKQTPADGSSTSVIPGTRFFRKFIKLRSHIQWDEQGQITDDIFLCAISDSAAVSHPGAVAGFIRLYFKDM